MNSKKSFKLSEESIHSIFSRLFTSYVSMGLIGLFLCMLAGTYEKSFALPVNYSWEMGSLVLALVTVINWVLIQIFEEGFPSFRIWEMNLGNMSDFIPVSTLVYLAFIGALGEELLFRVGLQPYLGLAMASILMSVCYLTKDFKIFSLTGYAVVRSLLLGAVFYYMKDIYLVILAHFISNLTLYLLSRRRWENALKGEF